MSKLLLIFLFVTLNINPVFANITEKQLQDYMDYSLGGIILKSHHQELYKKFISPDDNSKNTLKFKKIINNTKHFDAFKNVFKSMNVLSYNKIMEFYITDIGRRYIEGRNKIETYGSRAKIRNEFKKLHIPEEKKVLIESIIKEFNLIELKMKYAIKYFYIYNNGLPKNMQKSKEELRKDIEIYRLHMEKYQNTISGLMYSDFTEEELRSVLAYAKTKEGKIEIKLIYKAATKYMESIMTKILKELTEMLQSNSSYSKEAA